MSASVELDEQKACAFVAAEALEICAEFRGDDISGARPWILGSEAAYEHAEAGLLYLIAGYDANAAVAARALEEQSYDLISNSAEAWALSAIKAFLGLRSPAGEIEPPVSFDEGLGISERVRNAIWVNIGTSLREHLRWLTYQSDAPPTAEDRLRRVVYFLEHDATSGGPVQARHSDLHHLLLLLISAMGETTGRALRSVEPPPNDGGRFSAFQKFRAANRPLLWPAAAEYARSALPGPRANAVVSVPTGAGKSSVAELAVAQAIRDGWVLYLTPTNALTGQVRRSLAESLGHLEGVEVRDFLGGLEYTELAGEALFGGPDARQVLVMTPEKCSLALRQDPDKFETMSLCVVDEAHILGDGDTRAVLSELVLSELLYRAPDAHFLLLSALLANPGELASWLEHASGKESVVIDSPWRPTRTLRALAGFSQEDRSKALAAARSAFEELPPSRMNFETQMTLTLLSNLQGAWKSENREDYALTRTNVSLKIAVHRKNGINETGYYSKSAAAFGQTLGGEGHRVLVFLSRSKHDSFKYAAEVQGFGEREIPANIAGLLALATAELGVDSALSAIIKKGVAVHTSAMLREEQRASEIAFDEGVSRMLFATGTLAQGLNLPATAVIVGGTNIGYDANQDPIKAAERVRAQLLNSIGRAGRAYVSARSIAVIIPSDAITFAPNVNLYQAKSRARFLSEEDASSEVESQLDGLIAKARDGSLDMTTMNRLEDVAFSFLSFSAEGTHAAGVIGKSWAAYRARATDEAEGVARAIGQLGTRFLSDQGFPDWISLAAHKAGLSLRDAAAVQEALQICLSGSGSPATVLEWVELLLEVLQSLPEQVRNRILLSESFNSTRIMGIWEKGESEKSDGWTALRNALISWVSGRSIISMAEDLLGVKANPAGRGQGSLIPKMLGIVEHGFSYRLSIVAGAIGATFAAGRESLAPGPWVLSEESLRYLNLLPLAIRLGAGTPEAIAWMRAGARPRAIAHILSEISPAPIGLDDDELRRYAQRQIIRYPDLLISKARNALESSLIQALLDSTR
ncbi:DEAD/DEAH box helicase [Streptomyces sp. CB04723]|uniref:DEAD/DEAH box helicase n=1 Tax=Streptomyces TaxID=1883 RepID=UPI0015C4D02D|nr:DEAD/DEAH box helicase [Streptomyces sp. CB04723]QLG32324.1 DEAD/DEAH box helicase [Streptomyces sp. CB04723]